MRAHLRHLVAHREHRIERGHRLLEDHRDPRAAERAHLRARAARAVRVASKVTALPAPIDPGAGTSRMIESAVTDLPHPDSPTRPSVSCGAMREGHAIDRARDGAAHLEARAQVAHVQHGRRHRTSTWRGSKASRRPSPSTFAARQVITIARPGKTDIHQSVASCSEPSWMMSPSSAWAGARRSRDSSAPPRGTRRDPARAWRRR